VATVLDAEAFGDGDLHRFHVVAVPDRFEDRVGEPEIENLLKSHLSEIVIDPIQLVLIDVLVQLSGKRVRRRAVVAELLLDDDASRLG
jgi:hypothetical protein